MLGAWSGAVPMAGCGSGGGGGGGNGPTNPFPECNTGGSALTNSNLNFIVDNWESANLLSLTSGVPFDWILGWAALESSSTSPQGNVYGTVPQAGSGDNNFLGQTGSGWAGQIPCATPVGANGGNSTFACFDSFYADVQAALRSKYGAILEADAAAGDTASQAFTAVYAAGWDKTNPALTGSNIQSTITRHITPMLNCLIAHGYLPSGSPD